MRLVILLCLTWVARPGSRPVTRYPLPQLITPGGWQFVAMIVSTCCRINRNSRRAMSISCTSLCRGTGSCPACVVIPTRYQQEHKTVLEQMQNAPFARILKPVFTCKSTPYSLWSVFEYISAPRQRRLDEVLIKMPFSINSLIGEYACHTGVPTHWSELAHLDAISRTHNRRHNNDQLRIGFTDRYVWYRVWKYFERPFDSSKGYPGEGPCDCKTVVAATIANDDKYLACRFDTVCIRESHYHRQASFGAAKRLKERKPVGPGGKPSSKKPNNKKKDAVLQECEFLTASACGIAGHVHVSDVVQLHECDSSDSKELDDITNGLNLNPTYGADTPLPAAGDQVHLSSGFSDGEEDFSPVLPKLPITSRVVFGAPAGYNEQKHGLVVPPPIVVPAVLNQPPAPLLPAPAPVIPVPPVVPPAPVIVPVQPPAPPPPPPPPAPLVITEEDEAKYRQELVTLFVTLPNLEDEVDDDNDENGCFLRFVIFTLRVIWYPFDLMYRCYMWVRRRDLVYTQIVDEFNIGDNLYGIRDVRHDVKITRARCCRPQRDTFITKVARLMANYYRHCYKGLVYSTVVANALATIRIAVIKGDGKINPSIEIAVDTYLRNRDDFDIISGRPKVYNNTLIRIINCLVARGLVRSGASNPFKDTAILNRIAGRSVTTLPNAPYIVKQRSNVPYKSLLCGMSLLLCLAVMNGSLMVNSPSQNLQIKQTTAPIAPYLAPPVHMGESFIASVITTFASLYGDLWRSEAHYVPKDYYSDASRDACSRKTTTSYDYQNCLLNPYRTTPTHSSLDQLITQIHTQNGVCESTHGSPLRLETVKEPTFMIVSTCPLLPTR